MQRVGADRSQTRVNVRLITATNRDLQARSPPAPSARISTSV